MNDEANARIGWCVVEKLTAGQPVLVNTLLFRLSNFAESTKDEGRRMN